MGLVATVKKFVRGDDEGTPVPEVDLDPSDTDLYTAEIYAGSGVDAPPLPDDAVHVTEGPESGSGVVMGYLDPKNEGIALPGERRTYSRDEDGEIVAVLYLTRDGTIFAGTDDAEDAAGLASKINDRFGRLEDKVDSLIGTYNTHTHPVATTGSATSQSGTASTTAAQETTLGAGSDVSSERLKVDA